LYLDVTQANRFKEEAVMATVWQLRRPSRSGKRRALSVMPLLVASAVGAALAFIFDPDVGRRRRAVTRDRLLGAVRHGARRMQQRRRRAAARVYGFRRRHVHPHPAERTMKDEVTLGHAVESRLFRHPEIPKGRINVNVESGVVVLRGQLDRPEQIRMVEETAAAVPGVHSVHSLLHLPGTPAPNKAAAWATVRGPTGELASGQL
jgi:BON domain